MKRAALFTVGVLAAVGLTLLVRPLWRPEVPHREPPKPNPVGLEPALAKRIDEVRALVLADPDSAEAWGRLGAVFDVHDLFASAITCYAQAELLDPDEFRWPYLLGRSRMVGDQRVAMADFERALTLRDDYATLHLRLGRGSIALDDLDRAQAAFTRAAELEPDLARAHLGLGRVALARGNAPDALGHLQVAVNLGASSGELHGLLAEANRRVGNSEAAAMHIERAAEGAKFEPLPDPIHRELTWAEGVTLRWHEMRGEQHRKNGRPDLALSEWEAAVRENPTSVRAHANLGLLYAQAGRHADAIRMFTRVVELDPEQTEAQRDIGTLHIRSGQVSEGLAILRRFCDEHPDDVDAHIHLARALRTADRMSEAEELFREMLLAFPDNAIAYFEYGVLEAGAGRMPEAVALFTRSTELDPTNVLAHLNRARAFGRLERFAEELDGLRDALAVVPGDRRLTNALAWFLATCPDDDLRDGPEALRLAQELSVRTNFGHAVTLDTLGAAFAEIGEFESAISTLERALALPASARSDAVEQRLRSRLPTYRNGTPHRDANLNE